MRPAGGNGLPDAFVRPQKEIDMFSAFEISSPANPHLPAGQAAGQKHQGKDVIAGGFLWAGSN